MNQAPYREELLRMDLLRPKNLKQKLYQRLLLRELIRIFQS